MKTFVCIICPNGCEIEVEYTGKEIKKISGNLCDKGEAYIKKEITAPERWVTSTIEVKNGTLPLVSVKTSKPVPKDKVLSVMDAIANIEIEAPVEAGEIILRNVASTNADIIATRKIERKTNKL